MKAYNYSILVSKSEFKRKAEIFTRAKLTVLTHISGVFFQGTNSDVSAFITRVNIPQLLCYSLTMEEVRRTLIIYSRNPTLLLARTHMYEARMASEIRVWCSGCRSHRSRGLCAADTTPAAMLFLSHR